MTGAPHAVYYRSHNCGCRQVVRPELPNPNQPHTARYQIASELGVFTLDRTRWDYVSLTKVHQTCPPKKSGLRCWRPLCFALERVTGFEPANASLGSSCRTTWRHPHSALSYHNRVKLLPCRMPKIVSVHAESRDGKHTLPTAIHFNNY